MVIALVAAWAGPVVCDPERARALLEETGVPADRVPVIAPGLLPGLLRAQTEGPTRALLDALCVDPESASLSAREVWETARFSAYTFDLARSRMDDCAIVSRSATLTVGVTGSGELETAVLSESPPAVQPIGACPAEVRYREETVVAGSEGPVRLVLQVDVEGSERDGRVLVRRATPNGFVETTILDPAPGHLLGGVGGPQVTLTTEEDPWIVVHHATEGEPCRSLPGQEVWIWLGDRWEPHQGRAALGRLADRGLWRLASDDGWFVVLAQDAPSDLSLLQARVRKRRPLTEERITLRESGSFPLMNAGFLFAAPDPWPTREGADAFLARWPRKTGVYVRQGWTARPACPVNAPPGATTP